MDNVGRQKGCVAQVNMIIYQNFCENMPSVKCLNRTTFEFMLVSLWSITEALLNSYFHFHCYRFCSLRLRKGCTHLLPTYKWVTFLIDFFVTYYSCVCRLLSNFSKGGIFGEVINILLQIPGSTHYSIVMYFVTNTMKKGSLLQRFFDGDDEFRNSRLKLIPAVPKVCFSHKILVVCN